MQITDNTICLASVDPPQLYDFYGSIAYAQAKQDEANAHNKQCQEYGAVPMHYQIMTYGEYLAKQREFYLKDPPEEITEAKFIEMLEVLPPKAWRCDSTFESFLMSEHWSGPYTQQYVRHGERYYSKLVDATDKTTWMTAQSVSKEKRE